MCVNAAKMARRHQRRIINQIWRREAREALGAEETMDAFTGESIAEDEAAAVTPRLAVADTPEDDGDQSIMMIAGMSVQEDGLPFGYHIITRAELRRSLSYAA